MKLTADAACTELRTYRTDLPPAAAEEVAAAFGARVSARRRPSVPGVASLWIARDEVVIVLATGRVQLRIDAGTPRHDRRRRAEVLFVELVRAALECGAARAGNAGD